MLKPLAISVCSWINITLDFVTDLPVSNGFNTDLIIIDYLTKERHYIPCPTDENSTTTEATTQL